MEKYLVTGGAGFIGSHLVEVLLREGKAVRVFDNLSTGFEEHISLFIDQIEFIKADLADFVAVQRAMQGVTHVFHVGALRAVKRSVDDPRETNESNVTGTLNVLTAARNAGVQRVVYSSSSSVYGDAVKFPLSEEDKVEPLSPYAASKLIGECYCRLFSQLYALETVCLRYFNVFGPRQRRESRYSTVIPVFVSDLLQNKPSEIHWDGMQSRDFSYIDNIIHANLKAMQADQVSGQVFNIGSHEECSILDLYREICTLLDKTNIQPKFTSKRTGDVRRTLANITKARERLGYRVQTQFKEGLRKTVSWFVESGMLSVK
jgi:UDP-glucose 4-epimerase